MNASGITRPTTTVSMRVARPVRRRSGATIAGRKYGRRPTVRPAIEIGQVPAGERRRLAHLERRPPRATRCCPCPRLAATTPPPGSRRRGSLRARRTRGARRHRGTSARTSSSWPPTQTIATTAAPGDERDRRSRASRDRLASDLPAARGAPGSRDEGGEKKPGTRSRRYGGRQTPGTTEQRAARRPTRSASPAATGRRASRSGRRRRAPADARARGRSAVQAIKKRSGWIQ